MSARLPLRVGIPVVAAGGVLGALLRWQATAHLVQAHGFPWTVFAINVLGSALLAGLPALATVFRHAWLPPFLGTGVLGGFTTMSTASTDTARLLDSGQPTTALLYLGGTLAAALVAVALVDRASTPEQRAEFEREEGDG